ncbi:MAG: type IV pilin protein [Hydrogenophilus sp.]|nr:type IV pilin protein [Hydrogenophilus sp.]
MSTPSLSRTLLGITLLELVVVLAIVAILAAIAYPSYRDHILKTRRAAATACLLDLAQNLEQRYSAILKYEAIPLQAPCVADLSAYYTFSYDGDVTSTAFRLKATALGSQAEDKVGNTSCRELTLRHTGERSPPLCWQR